MQHCTTIYKLIKDDEEIVFNSEKDACKFLGVSKCTVASCYRRNGKCKGYTIEKVGISTHHETKTRLHKIWESMHERCENKNHKYYKNYGGRGIVVCEEWATYINFRDWALSNEYANNLTIDRINVNGCYEPSNCRWATVKEQQNNKSNNRIIEFNNAIHTLSEWAQITGIKSTTLKERLNRGWSVSEALTRAVRKKNAKMDGGRKMIDIVLKGDETGYDAVGTYILRYWEHNIPGDVIVSLGASYDGNTYELMKEVAYPAGFCGNDIEFLFDWWEGQKYIKLFGIKTVEELDISGGIYEE